MAKQTKIPTDLGLFLELNDIVKDLPLAKQVAITGNLHAHAVARILATHYPEEARDVALDIDLQLIKQAVYPMITLEEKRGK